MIWDEGWLPASWTADLADHLNAIALIVATCLLAAAFGARMFRGRRRGRRPGWTALPGATLQDIHDLRDPLRQMDAIAQSAFECVPLLNREEARLLPILEAAVREVGDGHRLMAQTSLGELIRPSPNLGTTETRRRAFASINSKRLDFAVINRYGYLVLAIEYHGSGHYHKQSFIRDAVKREALRKAGVPTIEVPERFKSADLRADLLGILGKAELARSGT